MGVKNDIIKQSKDTKDKSGCFVFFRKKHKSKSKLEIPKVHSKICIEKELDINNSELSEIECAICTDLLYNSVDQIKTIDCMHVYHKECIYRWLENHNTCPECRMNISLETRQKTPRESLDISRPPQQDTSYYVPPPINPVTVPITHSMRRYTRCSKRSSRKSSRSSRKRSRRSSRKRSIKRSRRRSRRGSRKRSIKRSRKSSRKRSIKRSRRSSRKRSRRSSRKRY
jgi:hypothetical protein